MPFIDDFFQVNPGVTTDWCLETLSPDSKEKEINYFEFPLIVSERSGSLNRNEKYCLEQSIGLGRGTLAYNAPELYTILSGTPPFSNIRSTSQLIIIKTKFGFFAPEAQSLVMKWKNPDPTDWQWQFPDSSYCSSEICSFVRALVDIKPSNRPSALEVCHFFNHLSDHV